MEFPNKISLAAVKSRFFTRLFVTVLSHTATKKKREKRKKKKSEVEKRRGDAISWKQNSPINGGSHYLATAFLTSTLSVVYGDKLTRNVKKE